MILYWRPTTSDCLYTIYDHGVYVLAKENAHGIVEDEWQWQFTGWQPSELRANGFEMIGEL